RANVIEVAPAKRGEIEVASAQPGVGNRYAVQDGIVGVGHDVPRPIATIDVDVLPLGSSQSGVVIVPHRIRKIYCAARQANYAFVLNAGAAFEIGRHAAKNTIAVIGIGDKWGLPAGNRV